MGLYDNLEPALHDIIQKHKIKIMNERSFFHGGIDPVFCHLQVGMYKHGLKQASENLMIDRRFSDANGSWNDAGFAVASYIKDRMEAPDQVDDDGLVPHEYEFGCVMM